MLRLLAALVLAIMLVPLLSSASAQDATPTVNTDDSLEGNLYALGILIQARAATTYQRDFDASGDGPRSFDFLLMEFDDDASASIAMKMTLEYFASFDLEDESDDQKNHLDYVHITNVGDEQYAAHSNDGSELFRTDYGYVAVRFGSIVFYAQTHGNSFNPLTPLVEFSVSVADCLGQRSPESDDDLALCLPGFDLMPAFFDEFIFALSPSTDPVPTVIKQGDPNRFEATGNISSSVSILALPGTYTVTFACQGTGESYAWIGYPYDLLGYIETTGTELDLSFSGAVVAVTIGIRCNGEWSIIGTR